MVSISKTISEVEKLSPELASQIKQYVKNHSYGLVFERNLPDAVRLWNKKLEVYDKVHILPFRGQLETDENYKIWRVINIVDNDVVVKKNDDSNEEKVVNIDNVVSVVEYNDEIYPGLKVIDKVERGDKDAPYHMLINAENYHALQMLRYAYAGKVDCIYIDPPYNKRESSDWQYNCSYISDSDEYKHSKWLTMIERRLRLARDLLNFDNSVLIVTIDENEFCRLGLLLEQIFPEVTFKDSSVHMQMISSMISSNGNTREPLFKRTNEYIYILTFGKMSVVPLSLLNDWFLGYKGSSSKDKLNWISFMRTGTHSLRSERPNLFYPIFVSKTTYKVVDVGSPLPLNVDKSTVPDRPDCFTIFPIHSNGQEGCWRYGSSKDQIGQLICNGYFKVSVSRKGCTLYYLSRGEQNKINNHVFDIVGYNSDGSIIVGDANYSVPFVPGSQWKVSSHDATTFGTNLLSKYLINRDFTFPKSLYAVEDVLRFFVVDKPEALIVDFFAGSGTTAHATMLLNHLDGGHRRCISVTNNEVGPDNEKQLTKQGLRPTDEEWQSKGIARYITWERIKAAITGIATNGELVKGDYKFIEEFPMSDGFKENAIFCELTYENYYDVQFDRVFNAIAPVLWMFSGCKGKIIEKLGKGYATTDYYGVLFEYKYLKKFVNAVKKRPFIKHIFVVTDDIERYNSVLQMLNWIDKSNIHRLYERYLDNFELKIKAEGGIE